MPDTSTLLTGLLLYLMLPLWSIAGLADWYCHRVSRIESTSGLKESLMHSAMGIQVGIPIILCLRFEVNVLVLLICFAAWVLHELVAHWDVHYANDLREITIWEMHAHSYLATLPLFMLATLSILNWHALVDLLTLNWEGGMTLISRTSYPGGYWYFSIYMAIVFVVGIVPYAEENWRCLRTQWQAKG